MSKDLFDLFRENQDKLNQQPSPTAWSRIERRIQPPRAMGKRRSLRTRSAPMGVAAALALVIGLMVAFIWILSQQKEQHIYALAQAAYEVEDLVVVPSQDHKILEQQIVRAQMKKSSKPINEGRPEQKLIAKTEKRSTSRNSSESTIDSVRNERIGK